MSVLPLRPPRTPTPTPPPAAARSTRRTARSRRRPSCRSARRATVKGLTVDQVRATGAQMILGNTYHLALRPGEEIVARARRPAPLHGLGRPDPDRQRRLSALQPRADHEGHRRAGASFARTSTAACSSSRPSGPIAIQEALGSDVAMVLDHVVAAARPTDDAMRDACERTVRWAARCQTAAQRAATRRSSPSCKAASIPSCASWCAAAARRARFPRLRDRRPERRRDARRDVPHSRRRLPRPARRTSRAT